MHAPERLDLRTWERWMAHAGYISEGLLYLLLGAFALLPTLDARRRPSGTQGVLVRLSLTAPGELLLAIVALGLVAYVGWQLLVALRDPEHRRDRDQRRRRLARVGHLLSGALNSVIVIEAMRVLFRFTRSTDDERSQREWITRAMDLPLGRVVVAGIGIAIAVYGSYELFRALSRYKDSTIDVTHTRLRPLLDVLGIYGLLSRGVMFALIGIYLLFAALRRHAQYAVGVAGALRTLQQQRPYGGWLLGTVAAGLVTYGLWLIAKEPYRRLRAS